MRLFSMMSASAYQALLEILPRLTTDELQHVQQMAARVSAVRRLQEAAAREPLDLTTTELSEEEIDEEVRTVRQEMYDAGLHTVRK
jgi:hypothetical protein